MRSGLVITADRPLIRTSPETALKGSEVKEMKGKMAKYKIKLRGIRFAEQCSNDLECAKKINQIGISKVKEVTIFSGGKYKTLGGPGYLRMWQRCEQQKPPPRSQ